MSSEYAAEFLIVRLSAIDNFVLPWDDHITAFSEEFSIHALSMNIRKLTVLLCPSRNSLDLTVDFCI